MKKNIAVLETKGRNFWVPRLEGDNVVWDESKLPPHFSSIQAHSCSLCVGYHWKRHSVLFNVIREPQGYGIMINCWSMTTDRCTPRRVPVKVEGNPLGWVSEQIALQYLKRWLLGEGLYTLAGLAPRVRKMIYQMLEAIDDEHVTNYYPGAKYRLSKHNGRWRISHDGKVCLDVVHLNMITQDNLYHMAV